MSPTRSPSATTISLALVAAIATATVTFLGLRALSLPEGFAGRTAAVAERAARIQRLARVPANVRDYRPGGLCAAATAEQIAEYAATLQTRATQAGLEVRGLNVTPEPSETSIARVAVQAEFTGTFDSLAGLLADLSATTPKLFADRVDMVDRGDRISLRFSGHYFCSTES